MTENAAQFDKTVGTVAGAIYSDVAQLFPQPPLMLVPPITFKVRRVLEHVTDLRLMTSDQKEELAREIRVSIVPVLFSMEVEPETIERMAPAIEAAALAVLMRLAQGPIATKE